MGGRGNCWGGYGNFWTSFLLLLILSCSVEPRGGGRGGSRGGGGRSYSRGSGGYYGGGGGGLPTEWLIIIIVGVIIVIIILVVCWSSDSCETEPDEDGGKFSRRISYHGTTPCYLCLNKIRNSDWDSGLHRRQCAYGQQRQLLSFPTPYEGTLDCPRCSERLRLWPAQGAPFFCDVCPSGGKQKSTGHNRLNCFLCDYDICDPCANHAIENKREVIPKLEELALSQNRQLDELKNSLLANLDQDIAPELENPPVADNSPTVKAVTTFDMNSSQVSAFLSTHKYGKKQEPLFKLPSPTPKLLHEAQPQHPQSFAPPYVSFSASGTHQNLASQFPPRTITAPSSSKNIPASFNPHYIAPLPYSVSPSHTTYPTEPDSQLPCSASPAGQPSQYLYSSSPAGQSSQLPYSVSPAGQEPYTITPTGPPSQLPYSVSPAELPPQHLYSTSPAEQPLLPYSITPTRPPSRLPHSITPTGPPFTPCVPPPQSSSSPSAPPAPPSEYGPPKYTEAIISPWDNSIRKY